jgi:hypothetical protein
MAAECKSVVAIGCSSHWDTRNIAPGPFMGSMGPRHVWARMVAARSCRASGRPHSLFHGRERAVSYIR